MGLTVDTDQKNMRDMNGNWSQEKSLGRREIDYPNTGSHSDKTAYRPSPLLLFDGHRIKPGAKRFDPTIKEVCGILK